MVLLRRVHDYEDRTTTFQSLQGPYHRQPYKGRSIYSDERGVLYIEPQRDPDYAKYGDFLEPFALDSRDKEGLVSGHLVDAAAPYRCGRCHTDRVQCFHPGSYETDIRCPECGTQTVVHSG